MLSGCNFPAAGSTANALTVPSFWSPARSVSLAEYRRVPAALSARQLGLVPISWTSAAVSAPVSRESGLLSDGFDRKQQHTLSAAEAEAAKISGVTPTEYLKQKLKLQQMKANGEIV